MRASVPDGGNGRFLPSAAGQWLPHARRSQPTPSEVKGMIRSPGSKAEKVNWGEKEALTDHDEDADALVGVVRSG